MNKLLEQKQQVQEQTEQISEELVQKFDGDKQLVQEFLSQGYTQEDLIKSTVTHPTKFDPLCTLKNGHVAGMWIETTGKNHRYQP